LPKAVAQVLNKILKEIPAPSVTALLFDLCESSDGVHSGTASIFDRHAPCNVFTDLPVEVLAKLSSHLLIHFIGAKE
jgi:hypothetical protein